MRSWLTFVAIAAWSALFAAACIAPEDQRPGLWLSGEETPAPSDWAFTDAHKEIALQVATRQAVSRRGHVICDGVVDVNADFFRKRM